MNLFHVPSLSASRLAAWGLAFATLCGPARLSAAGEQRFDSPETAVRALTAAIEAQDTNAVRAIFGPDARELMSPDAVQASGERELFVRRLKEKTDLVRESDFRVVLQIGAEGWPFPIPLTQLNGQWFFDIPAGKQEVLNRRIGRDEIGAIEVCRAYVSAQREYASQDRDGDEVLEYAPRLRSTPGTHDGLYWPLGTGEEVSPLGPLIAAARVEGYRRENRILTDTQSPYHGYFFKILTQQGRHAPGGKYRYVINGNMIGGFALAAWPAQWGNSGIMTFIVNQQGKVYQKNLGPRTSSIAGGLTTYDPDGTWTEVRDH